MKIAVTGVNGHLGSEIITALRNDNRLNLLVGITRNPDKTWHKDIELRQGNYNNLNSYKNALKGIDILLMISTMDAPDIRIRQHRNVINAAKENGVQKIIFSSILGKEGNTTFDPLLKSYRQTEKDIQESGMHWIVGRNGLYIEPDVDYIDKYKQAGEIANSAGDGLASYTTRKELAEAYVSLIKNEDRNNKMYVLAGEPITQQQLTEYMNRAFGMQLKYREMSPEKYLDFQKKVNGEFLGTIVAGIYEKIRNGEFFANSDYEAAAGRKHISWDNWFEQIG